MVGVETVTGGKYWILQAPPAGLSPIFRVQIEVDENRDSVTQVQPMG